MTAARRPAHDVGRVLKRRDRLAAALADALAGGRTPDGVAEAARAAARVLGGRAAYDALYRSLLPLVDPVRSVRDAAWALAGNLGALRAGRPALPGVWPEAPADVPAQVLAVRRAARFGKAVVVVACRALAGPGCPGAFRLVWSESKARYLGTHPKAFGLAADRPTRYRHPSQLVGCRFLARVTAKSGGAAVEAVGGTPALRDYNQRLARMRLRDGWACPKGYTHACHVCPVGQDGCPAATHPLTLVPVACDRCAGRGDADPYWDGTLCLSCLARSLVDKGGPTLRPPPPPD